MLHKMQQLFTLVRFTKLSLFRHSLICVGFEAGVKTHTLQLYSVLSRIIHLTVSVVFLLWSSHIPLQVMIASLQYQCCKRVSGCVQVARRRECEGLLLFQVL